MFRRVTHAASIVVAAVLAASVLTVAAVRTSAAVPQTSDSMSTYRTMATDALTAFKGGDTAAAKTKSRDLEKAWDDQQKALKSKSPTVWKSVDDAMDAFIKPIMKGGSPDPAKVQAAYDEFIKQLDAASAAH